LDLSHLIGGMTVIPPTSKSEAESEILRLAIKAFPREAGPLNNSTTAPRTHPSEVDRVAL
jgi:hypothetical protein